jgi:hypothetical protein
MSAEIDATALDRITLALEISRPVDPLVYEVHPTDEGEGEWWLAEPPARAAAPSLVGTEWEYLAARAREEGRGRWALEQRPLEMPADWWAGVLEGIRLGAEIARLPAPIEEAPVRPRVLGRSTR